VVKHLVAVPTDLVDHEIGQAVRNGVGIVPRFPGRSGCTGGYRLKMFARPTWPASASPSPTRSPPTPRTDPLMTSVGDRGGW